MRQWLSGSGGRSDIVLELWHQYQKPCQELTVPVEDEERAAAVRQLRGGERHLGRRRAVGAPALRGGGAAGRGAGLAAPGRIRKAAELAGVANDGSHLGATGGGGGAAGGGRWRQAGGGAGERTEPNWCGNVPGWVAAVQWAHSHRPACRGPAQHMLRLPPIGGARRLPRPLWAAIRAPVVTMAAARPLVSVIGAEGAAAEQVRAGAIPAGMGQGQASIGGGLEARGAAPAMPANHAGALGAACCPAAGPGGPAAGGHGISPAWQALGRPWQRPAGWAASAGAAWSWAGARRACWGSGLERGRRLQRPWSRRRRGPSRRRQRRRPAQLSSAPCSSPRSPLRAHCQLGGLMLLHAPCSP